MSKLYQLTQSIHQQLQRIEKEKGIEIEVEGEYYFSQDGQKWNKDFELIPWEVNLSDYIPEIQEPQIKQILVALSDVLGRNPDWDNYTEDLIAYICYFDALNTKSTEIKNKFEKIKENMKKMTKMCSEYIPLDKASMLCIRWLDGLDPLFTREPETVLGELLEILQSI